MKIFIAAGDCDLNFRFMSAMGERYERLQQHIYQILNFFLLLLYDRQMD